MAYNVDHLLRVGDAKVIYDTLNEEINGKDILNYVAGKNIDSSGAIVDDADKCVSDKIPVTWSGAVRYYCGDNTSTDYGICFYDSSDNVIQRYRNPSTTGGAVYRFVDADSLENVAYVRFSFAKNYTGKVTANVAQETPVYYTAESSHSSGLSERIENVENTKLSDYGLTFTASENIISGTATITAVQNLDVRKNVDIDFRAEIPDNGGFTTVTVGHGHDDNYAAYIVIDSTNITGYAVNNSETTQTFQTAHGFASFAHYIQVHIEQSDEQKAVVRLSTGAGTFVADNVAFDGRRGDFYASTTGATFGKCVISVCVRDINKTIWSFGDSYQSLGNPARYPYYFKQDGYLNGCLMSGFPGANASHLIPTFRILIARAKPKFVFWTIGMNGADSAEAINATWKAVADELIATCAEKGVTLIFATVPNVPDRISTFKNAYIKASGCRYVDMAKAVGAEEVDSTWFDGMLSSDNVHPTANGALALYSQILADFPESMRVE